MTLGTKLKKLRTEKGLTQKDLADQLHVTFQTVSKWENEENEPDIATLKELAKIYNVSVDFLISEEETPKEREPLEVKEPVAPIVQTVNKTVVIHQKECHVCARCKKDIEDENDLEIDHFCVRNARKGHAAEYRDDYYHRECLEITKRERAAKEREIKRLKGLRAKKLSLGWGIAGGVVALGISLAVLLAVPACKEALNPALAVLFSVLIGYAIFAALYCIISGSYIADVFLGVAGWSIKMPGVIFTWDIDGIVWAIGMKIFLAILGFLLGVMVVGLAVAISALLASVSFPFILVHNIHTQYSDAL